jgi:L-iditol 2-dehydrogenase
MKAVVVQELGSYVITDIPTPEPAADEVLIAVTVTGLCRTDLKIIRVGHRDLTLPRVPGEEVVGEIVKLGAEVSDFKEGDRVYVYPGTSCGQCKACVSGAGNLCKSMSIMGFHRDGGFAPYVTAPAASLIPIANNISDDEAVFAEPLSCCLNALELARLGEGERIAIWGAGPAGTLLNRASKALGAEPFNIEPDRRRRELIGGYEVVPDSNFDVAIVAVGDRDAYVEALGCLGPRGRLVVFAGLAKDGAEMTVEFNQMHYLELSIVGAYGCSYRHGQWALELIADGRVQVKDMISHRMELTQVGEALDLVAARAGMKILLYP